jgi:hypothetical protein
MYVHVVAYVFAFFAWQFFSRTSKVIERALAYSYNITGKPFATLHH